VNPQDPSRPPVGCEDEVVQAVGQLLRHSSWGALRAGLIAQAIAPTADARRPVTFALASCLYPCDILDHMPDDEEARWGPADCSLLALGALIDQRAGDRIPTLLVLAGDQVYVDATAGLFDPKLRDDKFRIAYERLFASRGAKAVLQRLGLDVEMLLDDHEISDNWEPADLPRDPAEKSNRDFGIEAYWKFQRGVDGAPDMNKPLWRARSHLGLSFFLGDTRTERETRSAATFTHQRIMKERQRLALFKWLVNPALDGRPRFVVTPSILLPRHVSVAHDPATALHSDAWEGHPHSMHALLRHICDNAVQHLVFLSGDEHLSCVVQVELSNSAASPPVTTTFHSIHSPSLYAPYPFANSAPADFICDESFAFPVPPCGPPGPYLCRVSKLHMRSGDGFVLIAAACVDDGWLFDVDFHTTSPARLFIPSKAR
jgi:cholesterol oxidase